MNHKRKKHSTRLLVFLLPAVMASSAAAQDVRFARTDYPVGSAPASVIAADFNGDGKLDLAVANSSSNTVSILLGKGDGSFGPKTDFVTSAGPKAVIARDFDGDGKLDLAVAGKSANMVSILLGKGDGTFGAPTNFAVGNGPVSVATADFNGDGKLDLAVANHDSDTASVLLGKGDGSFGTKTDFVTGALPSFIAAGDFNGDGKLDLAVANFGPDTVSILAGKGDGTFGPKTDFVTGLDPKSLTTAVFNLNHRLDVATANSSASTASVLLGKGDGTFDPKIDLGTDTGPISVTAADFNGDGKADLLTGNMGYGYFGYGYFPTVSLRQGNGNGTFGPRADFSTGSDPASVATGDFNGDGNLDVATADDFDNKVSVLLRDPLVPNPGSVDFGSQVAGSTSTAHTVTVTHSGNAGSATFAIQAVTIGGTSVADFNKTSDTCSGATFQPGETCGISVRFSPKSVASSSAVLTIADNAAGNPHSVPLSGMGVSEISLSPSSLSLGASLVGSIGAPATVTMTNNADTTLLNITSVAISGANSGEFSLSAGAGACPSAGGTLAPRTSCTISVAFSPQTLGSKTAMLTITDSAGGSPQTVALSGTGTDDFSISATGSSATVAAGQTATYTLTLAGVTQLTRTVLFTCTDAPRASTCSISPNSLALSGTTPATATVSVATTAHGLLLPYVRLPRLLPNLGLPLLLVLLTLALLASSRQHGGLSRRAWAGLGGVVLFAALSVGCGEGSASAPQGTPAGTYTLTITSTSGGVSHNTTLTLKVQ
jgi:ankyrin repeat protein